MKNILLKLTILIILMIPLKLIVVQTTIRLICKYSNTVDKQGNSRETTGENLVTVTYSDNGKAIIKKDDLGAEFIGTISEEKIYGETNYQIQNSMFYQTLIINRYTGAFEITFRITGKSDGIVHYGKCEKATNKLY